MERNAKCFCGSGRKSKFCHPEIEEDSMMADLVLLGKEIDRTLDGKESPIGCYPGCDECCYQIFSVSLVEFLYACYGYERSGGDIQELMKLGTARYDQMITEHPEVKEPMEYEGGGDLEDYVGHCAEQAHLSEYLRSACVFLDEETHLCKIYAYRPLVCRFHGVGTICGDMVDAERLCSKGMNVPVESLVDLEEFAERIARLPMFLSKKHGVQMVDLSFPIAYFCWLFWNGRDDYKYKMQIYKHVAKGEYADAMYERFVRKHSHSDRHSIENK